MIGSFQSYRNEIDPDGAARHGIGVVRRISGGGAMFMEPGNCITYSLVVFAALAGTLGAFLLERRADDDRRVQNEAVLPPG